MDKEGDMWLKKANKIDPDCVRGFLPVRMDSDRLKTWHKRADDSCTLSLELKPQLFLDPCSSDWMLKASETVMVSVALSPPLADALSALLASSSRRSSCWFVFSKVGL